MQNQPYQQQQPGYVHTTAPPQVPSQQHTFVTQTVVTSPTTTGGMQSAIPDLPLPFAIIFGILNIFSPGVGTILAGVSVLFCGSIRQSGSEKVGVFCTNFWVGLLQMLLAPFVVGWIWSIVWGIFIIAASGSTEQQQTPTHMSTTIVSSPPPQLALPQPVYSPSYPQPAPVAPAPVAPQPHKPVQAW